MPLHASERFRGKSSRGLYGDVVSELDWSVGEVLRTLKDEGLDNNTIVFFSSDNGPWLTQFANGGSAGLLKDGKSSTWEGGMREPFIARWPGKIPAGVVTQAFGSTLDVFPTFAKLAGAEIPKDRVYDGQDLGPVLFQRQSRGETLFFYYWGDELRAVRKGDWKLHIAVNNTFPNSTPMEKLATPQLYHLTRDPSEKYDVSDSNPAVVKDLLAALEEHQRGMKPGPRQR